MIQRIQSLYLLLASIAMAMTLHFPLASVVIGSDEILLRAYEVTGIPAQGSTMWIFICIIVMLALPTVLSAVIIFLYKNRMLQIRLCVSEIVLLVGSLACTAIFCWRMTEAITALPQYQGVEMVFKLGWPSIMPVIAIIFVVLALRGVAKDEALVRSLDRIR